MTKHHAYFLLKAPATAPLKCPLMLSFLRPDCFVGGVTQTALDSTGPPNNLSLIGDGVRVTQSLAANDLGGTFGPTSSSELLFLIGDVGSLPALPGKSLRRGGKLRRRERTDGKLFSWIGEVVVILLWGEVKGEEPGSSLRVLSSEVGLDGSSLSPGMSDGLESSRAMSDLISSSRHAN